MNYEEDLMDMTESKDGYFEDEVLYVNNGGSKEDNEFDEIVGNLEMIIMDNEFVNLQNQYCRRYCSVFENTDENKLEYTPIFDNYTATVESYIERRLKQKIPNFSMDRFIHMCQSRKDEVCGDVFDILLSCGDFNEFKFLMLSHKSELNAKSNPDLNSSNHFQAHILLQT